MRAMRKARCLIVAAALLVCGSTVRAASEKMPPGWPPAGAEQNLPWVRVISATLLVVGLICVGVYLLKKLTGGGFLRRGRYLELLESRPIGRKLRLFLVRVADRVVLLSLSGDRVTRLAEFPSEELPQVEPEQEEEPENGFEGLLNKIARVQG